MSNSPTNHFVIWMEDGKVMYSELDDAEPAILLSRGDTLPLKYHPSFFTDLKYCPPYYEDYDLQVIKYVFNPESMEPYKGGSLLNKKQFVLESYYDDDNYYEYFIIPVDKLEKGLRLYDIDVKYDETLGKSIISTSISTNFFEVIGRNENEDLSIDEVWRSWDSDYSLIYQSSLGVMCATATINEDMSVECGDFFDFCGKSYQRSSLDNPETIDKLYTIVRGYFFERVAIPWWIERAVRYEVLDNVYNNIIQAEQDVQRGKRYCFKETFESVEYSENPQYKYRLFSRDLLRHTSFYLYTNEPIVAELSYPKFIYFMGTFVRHSSEGYPDGILSDGIVLAYANDSDASPTQVVSHMFDEDYKGPHSRKIHYPGDPYPKDENEVVFIE